MPLAPSSAEVAVAAATRFSLRTATHDAPITSLVHRGGLAPRTNGGASHLARRKDPLTNTSLLQPQFAPTHHWTRDMCQTACQRNTRAHQVQGHARHDVEVNMRNDIVPVMQRGVCRKVRVPSFRRLLSLEYLRLLSRTTSTLPRTSFDKHKGLVHIGMLLDAPRLLPDVASPCIRFNFQEAVFRYLCGATLAAAT